MKRRHGAFDDGSAKRANTQTKLLQMYERALDALAHVTRAVDLVFPASSLWMCQEDNNLDAGGELGVPPDRVGSRGRRRRSSGGRSTVFACQA